MNDTKALSVYLRRLVANDVKAWRESEGGERPCSAPEEHYPKDNHTKTVLSDCRAIP
jgi:hypothetical protein